VVHEPFDDLPVEKTRYWRMGVPDWHPPMQLDVDQRPLLGTIGFGFPWKNYDELCTVTAANGWGLLLIAPRATAEDAARWGARQPHLILHPRFVPRHEAISLLAGCDATAFIYTCANTGQSGAICLGLAARKPVIALSHCRQFRALRDDPLAASAIWWVNDFAHLSRVLRALPIERCDPGIVAVAEQESWTHLGERYAQLYRSLL
jgi:hypothetical protein